MNETFFWYDYETFGADPKVDRPAQFAGVRTNLDLEEIDKPINIYCKPALDNLPSPKSCLITTITPQFCEQNGIFEHNFAALIYKELNLANTISVGYNSIKFDDELNRFLFWRNLFDPYSHTWDKGCSRWDLRRVVLALYALKPDAIVWPQDENKIISTKLEHLSKANNLGHESAHDALSDVRATISLARLIKTTEPKFFAYCLKLRNKDFVLKQFSSIDPKKLVLPPMKTRLPILHVSSMYGAVNHFVTIVFPLAVNPLNNKEVIVWDLQSDPTNLAFLSADEVKTRIFTRKDELPDNIKRLPIKTIAINKSPFVINDLRVLTNKRALELNLDLDKITRHLELARNLQLDHDFWQQVYFRSKNSELIDVDESLYQGFISDISRIELEKIRNMNENDLANKSYSFIDADKRLEDLVFRYRARKFPDSLNQEELLKWKNICFQKIYAKLPLFTKELNELRLKASGRESEILDKVQLWGHFLCENSGCE